MVTIQTKVFKNITVVLKANKVSTKYLNECGDIKELDDFYAYRVAEMARNGKVGKRKKTVITEVFTAIIESQAKQAITGLNKSINGLIKKEGLANTGGISTMLKNKGY
jgi:hypothetical protein